jgi:predicted ATPase/serine phosphatase RsbU (regulator of sigma subunit)/tRNA A-37 threonylcarbamoyl transferase component Bud32
MTGRIGEGGMSFVYLASDLEKQNRQVIAKILKSNITSVRTEDYIRFHSEATAVSKLHHPSIVDVLDIGEQDGYHFLIMEYIDGKSMHQLLKSGTRFSIEESVSFAYQLAGALEYIHGKGILHRDIKPGNIMVFDTKKKGAVEKKVKLIDFGLAQIKDFNDIKNSDDIAGTFSYMSPEQSGMIKQKVDERSDLYSLGVVFYQLISGVLPFQADDIMSLMHQHIATPPPPLSKYVKNIPSIIEKIINKLLEKEPEKRYQSSHGLCGDLKKYIEGDEGFEIGGEDRVVRLNQRTYLAGRDEEMKTLKTKYERSLQGEGGLVLISGEAGAGKTRLTEEFRRQVIRNEGVCLEGRCFSGLSKTPYKPFKDSLNHYLLLYANFKPEKQETVKTAMREALGELGGLILKLKPEMGEIVGECPPLVELEPNRENMRFLIEVSRFFRTLADIEKGLVIILEDLHLADEGTLMLIEEIQKEMKNSKLLLIANYRVTEIPAGHSLYHIIRESYENQLPLESIQLRALSRPEIEQITCGMLSECPENIEDIISLIYTKSKGNPFFAIEIVKQMADDHAIRIEDGRWVFDRESIGRIQISSTLLDIIFNRIVLLNKKERFVLRWAALIGRKFHVGFLLKLAKALNPEYLETEIVEMIDNSIRLGLLDEDYNEKGVVLFVHDRVREVFEEQNTPDDRKKIHQTIAELIEQDTDTGDKNRLYELANHYYYSDCWDKVLEYLIPAAEQARDNFANEDAIRYYKMAQELMESAGLMESDPWLGVRVNLGKLTLNIGRYDESITILQSVLPLMESPLEKAKIYREICTAFLKKGDKVKCEENGKLGLRLLGEYLPVTKHGVYINIFVEFLRRGIHDLFHFMYRNREMKRLKNKDRYEKDRLIVWFYITLNWIYIINDLDKFIRCSIRMYNLAESRLGKSKELGMAMGAYAALIMAIPLFRTSLRIHFRALKMRKELKDDWGISQSLQWIGYCYQWMGEYHESQKNFEQARQGFSRIGDMWEQGITEGGMDLNCIYLSEYDESIEYLHSYLKISEYSKNYFGLSSVYVDYMWLNNERGDFVLANVWTEKCSKLLADYPIPISICNYHTYYGEQCLIREDFTEAVKHLEEAKLVHENNSLMDQYVNQLYADLAEAYLGMYFIESNKHLKKRYMHLAVKMSDTALKKNRKWVTHYGKTLRIKGKILAVQGNHGAAEKSFQRAVKWDSDLGRSFELGRDFLDYGIFLRNTGRIRESRAKLESAYRLFRSAHSREYILKTGDLLGIREESSGTMEKFQAKQRLTSIMRMIQSISAILNLDSLLESIVMRMIEYTGAQRGLVFLKNGDTGELEVRAMKNMDGTTDILFSSHVVRQVFQKGESMITGNAAQDEAFYEFMSVVNFHLKSILCAPIKLHEQVIGVCYLDNPMSSSVFSRDDVELIEVILSQAAIAIENANMYTLLEGRVDQRTRELNQAYDIIKQDLRLAKRVQESLLPSGAIDIPGIDYHIEYSPMSEVGGDIYDVFMMDNGVLRIFLADATGHGVQAALMTMLIKSEYEQLKSTVSDPSEILEIMNTEIFNTYRTLTVFFTGIICDIHIDEKKIVFASAGHPDQYLFSGKKLYFLKSTGKLCGSMADVKYSQVEMKYSKKDKLVLFTDGLFEEFNPEGVELGFEKLSELAGSVAEISTGQPVKWYCNQLKGIMERHLAGCPRNDDLIIIGLELLK